VTLADSMQAVLGALEAADQTEGSPILGGLGLLLAGLVIAYLGLPKLAGWLLGPKRAVPESEQATWGMGELLLVIAMVIVGVSLGFKLLFFAGEPSPIDGLIASDLGLLIGAIFAGALAWQSAGRRPVGAMFGLGRGLSTGKVLAFGALGLALATPAILGLMVLAPELLRSFGHEPASQAVLMDVLSQRGLSLCLAVVLAGCVGPMLEEFLFRGFLQPMFRRNWGATGAMVLTSVLFASIHGLDAGIPIFLLSLLLCYLRERSGSLLAPVLAHCLWNSSTLLITLSLTS
jgi:membrane protease YdiL (CAAX protease family)